MPHKAEEDLDFVVVIAVVVVFVVVFLFSFYDVFSLPGCIIYKSVGKYIIHKT